MAHSENSTQPPEGEPTLSMRHALHLPRASTGLLILAVFYTVYLTRSLLLPIVFALLLSYLLSPMVRRLERWRIPPAWGAAVVLIAVLLCVAALVRVTWRPLVEVVVEMPENLEALRQKVFEPLQQLMFVLSRAGEEIQEMTRDGDSVSVVVEEEEFTSYLFTLTPMFIGAIVTTLILLYFFLAYKSVLFLRFIQITPRLEDKKRAVEIFRSIEDSVSTYLLTIFVINTLLGVTVGGLLALLGFPNPVFWGVIAGTFNFLPYLGSMIGVGLIALTAVINYDSLAQALVFPAVYATCSTLEGSFITPTIHGRSFTINPIIIIVGLLFWGWLWGVPGALLAVPILVVFKVVSGHLPNLKNVHELIGR